MARFGTISFCFGGFADVLEASWGRLGLSWPVLGAPSGRLGGVLGRLGTSWGHLGGVLERLKDLLGCFWGDFIGIEPFF